MHFILLLSLVAMSALPIVSAISSANPEDKCEKEQSGHCVQEFECPQSAIRIKGPCPQKNTVCCVEPKAVESCKKSGGRCVKVKDCFVAHMSWPGCSTDETCCVAF